EAVVFAMLASYILSRTIVPTMAKYLLRHQEIREAEGRSKNPLIRMQQRFEVGFERFRESYHKLLASCLYHRRAFMAVFFAACLGSVAILFPWLGQDFFPIVVSGSFNFLFRVPPALRFEDTTFLCD